MKRNARIYVAGADTLLGAALLERLREGDFTHLVGVPPEEPDLTDAREVERFFRWARPEYVFVASGRSGGIGLNRARPAELMLDNLLTVTHVLRTAAAHGVRKLLYLASSCCYPREAPQPLRVESLFSGPLEPTNAAYALARLAGVQLCQAIRQQEGACFVTAIPANPFGPHDDFSPESGHVIPALIRRMHEARETARATLSIWGSGTPRREFLYSRDLADACVFVMRHYDGPEPINLGGGEALSIAETARTIASVVGYRGQLLFDRSKPDGMPLKMLDCGPLQHLGWRPATEFRSALEATWNWFLQHVWPGSLCGVA
jgi:GDP-L-fucose synthase